MYTIMTYTEIVINLYIGIYVKNKMYIEMYKYHILLEESHTKLTFLKFRLNSFNV